MKCGDILLVDFPFTDTSATKLRPALIVSGDELNKGVDLVFVPISSYPDPNDPDPLHFPKSEASFSGSGLKHDSFIKWSKPMTLSRRIVRRRLGRLADPLLGEIRSRVRSLFE